MKDDAQLREILDRAAEMPTEQRAAFLDAACGSDASMRAEVDSLLLALDHADAFLDSPTIDENRPPSADAPREEIGSSIGAYRLLEKIGEGGMGVVYLAEQDQPVRRRVALKIIKPGMDSAAVIARFEAERQVLALMDHSNIARVYDAGTTSNGRPYFVMELVQGVSVTQYCDHNRLSPEQRLQLFIPICQAVQHAHQKGVIHRDLKPSNVLITVQDGKPVAKVIDFGIAKAVQQQRTEKTAFTLLGMLIGTPEYMSPEQAGPNPEQTDTRSDIYALGVMLYELLTGATPLDRKQLREAGYEQMMRTIREVEPRKPSTRLSVLGDGAASASALRRMEPRKLAKLLAGDLDVIVMKCLEKDRKRRYETANGLARDIERFLNSDPVEATAPSTFYILRKFAWKYRKPLSAGFAFVTLFTAFLITLVAVLWTMERAVAVQRDKAEIAGAVAAVARDEATRQRDEANRQRDEANRQTEAAEQARATAEVESYNSAIFAANAAVNSDNLTGADQFLNLAPDRMRKWEWNYLHAAANRQWLTVSIAGKGAGYCHVGRSVFFVNDDNSVRILDVFNGMTTYVPPLEHGLRVLTISADHRIAAVLPEATKDFSIHILNPQGKLLLRIPCALASNMYTASFSPDGKQLVTTPWARTTALVWDTATGRMLHELSGYRTRVMAVSYSLDGKKLVVGDHSGIAKVWDTATGICLSELDNPDGDQLNSAFGPDSVQIVSSTTSPKRQGFIWDSSRPAGRIIRSLTGGPPANENMDADFSPDGNRVAFCGGFFASIFDAHTGELVMVCRGHNRRVCAVAFSEDGSQVATSGNDDTLRAWTIRKEWGPIVIGSGADPVSDADFCDEGGSLLAKMKNGTSRIYDVSTGTLRTTVDFTAGKFSAPPRGSVPFDPNAAHVAVPSPNGNVLVLDVATGRVVATLGIANPGLTDAIATLKIRNPWSVTASAFTPDGRRLVTASDVGSIRIWDIASATVVTTLCDVGPAIDRIILSPSGDQMIASGVDRTGYLWNLSEKKLLGKLRHDRWFIHSFAFSHDGKSIVTASDDHYVRVWDAATANLRNLLRVHAAIFSAEFNRDDSRILLAHDDGFVGEWNAKTVKERPPFRGHEGSVRFACYSPDGTRVLSSSADGTARIWDADTNQELLALRGHTGPVNKTRFSRDGTKILTVSSDGTARVWDSVSAEQRYRKMHSDTGPATRAAADAAQ